MMTNVTLKVEAELAGEAKVLAARRGTSLSRLMAEQLEELIRRDRDYEAAKQRALTRLESGFDLRWTPPRSREELYELSSLRSRTGPQVRWAGGGGGTARA